MPAVSIVLAVYDPPIDALRAQLAAIAAQDDDRWECIVVDDASTRGEVGRILAEWTAVDDQRTLLTRATNGGIAAATNDGIDAAIGEFVTICDHDDLIHRGAVAAIIRHFADHPDHDVVYTDEQLIATDGEVIADYLKPDYSPRWHLGQHYLAHLVAARRDTIGALRVRREFEPAQDYDFYLRVIEAATERAHGVGHIAEVLYSWRAIDGSSARDAREKPAMADAVRRCSQAALDRRSIKATAVTVVDDGVPSTSVRVVADEAPDTSVSVVDVRFDATPAHVNALVAGATGDIVVLSPDPSLFDADWAAPLVCDAVCAGVGAVGPMILHASDTTVLSAGRTIGETLDDPFVGVAASEPGPWGAFFVAREAAAVAPFGLVVERAKFDRSGGLSTDVGLDAAVAELCAKLADSGAATIWNPQAILDIDLPGRARSLLDATRPGNAGWATLDTEIAVVERRVPGIRSHRLTPGGPPPPIFTEANPYRQALRLIASSAVRLVTADVFDTVVTRSVATPSDVFVELGRRLAGDGLIPGTVSPAVFAHARREAERRARRDHADATRASLRASHPRPTDDEIEIHPEVFAPECTLAEVWSRLPGAWFAGEDRTALVERELGLEAEYLKPIPETVEVFREAVRRSIPVVLVSDIYCSAGELRRLLGGAGLDLDLVDDIVTSADHRLGKAHGLLARVLDERGVDAENVMHLGDNDVADIETADGLGAHSIHVDIPKPFRQVEMPHPALRTWSRSIGSDLGISATVRSTLVNAAAFGRDPAYQYGAAVIGPALAGFSRWVSATTAALGATHVHCMLREGATIAELMAVTAPDGPIPIPIHVSRWVTMRAAVTDATPDQLLVALARRADLTVDHVVSAFGCDAALVRTVLGADRVDAGRLYDACTRLAGDDELRAQILRSAADLRARTLSYLREHLVVGPGPIVVADVGWGGTIQEGLERILLAGGIEHDIVGLYFALSTPGETRISRGARMLSYLPNEYDDPETASFSRSIAHHADTIERIMTPEIGTLIDIDSGGRPVTRPAGDDRLPPTLRTAQRAVREVVRRLADSPSGVSDLTDPRWSDDMGLRGAFARSIADAVIAPSALLATALGSWPHDDVAGAGQQSIASAGLTTALKYANARDLDLVDPTGRGWASGVAAIENPALSAQLAAERAGIRLDRLCPDSENGVARLAAFEVGSDLAALQVGRVVGVAPGGWSVLRLDGHVDSLRSIRFDAGEHDAMVDVAEFAVTLHVDRAGDDADVGGRFDDRRIDDLTVHDLVWVDAHPIDRRRFAHRAGGHLLVPIAPDLADRVRALTVMVAFRSWRLDDETSLADPPLAQRLGVQRRRIVDGVRRRIVR